MLRIKYHKSFKKDVKMIKKRGLHVEKLNQVITLLANEIPLPEEYQDHLLKGNYVGYRECHIEPDWLLIYKTEHNLLTLTLTHTGTHSDLFRK